SGRGRRAGIVPQIGRRHRVADVGSVGEIGRVRAGAAHAFDANQNDVGVDVFQIGPVQAPFFKNAQAEIFHQYVGFLYQLFYQLPALRRLHVDGEGFLAALELHEVGLLVPQLGVFAAMTVAAQARFAANDFRTELAEHAGYGWPGSAGGQLDNSYTFEGKLAHSLRFLWSDGVLE